MKKILLVSAVLFLVFAGCHGFGFNCHGFGGVRGSGISKEENRSISDFNAVNIGGAYEVDINCGAAPGVTIDAESNILPLIKSEISGNTLHIYNTKSINPRKKIKIKITVADLDEVETSGASNITVENINNDRIKLDASGAGKIYLAGKTGMLRLSLSGVVKVEAKDLLADNANVEISGASKADVYASKELRADISGVGSLDYYGNPANVRRSVSGVGSINEK
ncbi:MAG: head GIN domain-containing protein [Syntrophomonadaceae bacterium]